MNIVFVSNYINHHQIPVSDCLYKLTDEEYTFVQTEPMEEERVNMGWDVNAKNKPYVKFFYEDREGCEKLILNADCVIFGGCEDETIIRPRLEAGKFTVRYSERLYKEGRWKFISPRGLKKKHYDHTAFKHMPVYMLCAGAYVKGDFSLVGAYKGKMLKYGYFPRAEIYEDVHEFRVNNEKCEILWAARFIDWKHPEMMVKLAKRLKDDAKNAHITMVGVGELYESTLEMSKEMKLDDYISFAGGKTPDEVRRLMRSSDIFISTSDMKEGWGAVINEAMNSGCVTIASYAMGAVPYLIENGVNGFSYKAKSDKDLYKYVSRAINNRDSSLKMGEAAYKTINELWNAENAAGRLVDFIKDPEHKIPEYKDGPLSKA